MSVSLTACKCLIYLLDFQFHPILLSLLCFSLPLYSPGMFFLLPWIPRNKRKKNVKTNQQEISNRQNETIKANKHLLELLHPKPSGLTPRELYRNQIKSKSLDKHSPLSPTSSLCLLSISVLSTYGTFPLHSTSAAAVTATGCISVPTDFLGGGGGGGVSNLP